MTQPPNNGFFGECDLPEHGALQHGPETLPNINNSNATADPSDIVMDLSMSILDNSSFLHGSLLPQGSLSDATNNDGEAGPNSHGSLSATCQCLYHVIMVTDKVDLQDDCTGEKSLNTLLVMHKEALCNITNMLSCASCTGRVENVMVLAILMDKLARLSHHVVHATGDLTRPTPTLSLGDYQVDSAEEYATLIRSLLGVQLRRLQTLAQSLHQVSLRFHSDKVTHRLILCGRFFNRSLDALRTFGRED